MNGVKGFCACILGFLLLFAGCAAGGLKDAQTGNGAAPEQPADGGVQTEETMRITVTVNGTAFGAELENGEAASACSLLFPLELDMSELNGNEKYYYLDDALPAAAERVGRIEAGDIMLYGSSCIVLFYQSFSTSYGYTRIGKIANAEGLARAAGGGGARVSFAAA